MTAAGLDFLCALAAGFLAYEIRFDGPGHMSAEYLVLSATLPVLWIASIALAGGYDSRFIGVGSDEFRKVLNAAVMPDRRHRRHSPTRPNSISPAVMSSWPCRPRRPLTCRPVFLRKRLHKRRLHGQCMRRTIVVGHGPAVADLIAQLRRDSHHGLDVVAACVAGVAGPEQNAADVPVAGGLDSVATAVARFGADTVAVLACPEMNGRRLRELAWNLEKTSTEMYVASALLDVAGPRTTIRPVAGLPLLHVNHPELAGVKQVIKGVFDKVSAAVALLVLSPLFGLIALAIWIPDRESVFFRQIRVGRDGRLFRVWKFRTMVIDAEVRKAQLLAHNEAKGVLFKMRARPARHPGRRVAAPLVARRAPPAAQRARRGHVDGRAQAGAAGGNRGIRASHAAQARGQARNHRPLAGPRQVRLVLG